MSLDFEKYATEGVIGALCAVTLYTRFHTAVPTLLPYRSHIPNPTILYCSHTAAQISCHTVPIPSPNRSNTAPIPSYTALCIAYGVWQGVRSMAPYCKQNRAIPVWIEYWSSLSHTRAIPQLYVTGDGGYTICCHL